MSDENIAKLRASNLPHIFIKIIEKLLKEAIAEYRGYNLVKVKELKDIVEEYGTVDWSKKQDTQAKMRMQIKRLLKKYKYPPEYEESAIDRVVEQAEYMM